MAFNLNYFRPHAFGIEAEPEIAAFVRKIDVVVSDPQLSGMNDGDYSTEGFCQGWNAGNEFAYRAISSEHSSEQYFTLPAPQIEAIWRWNFNRQNRQQEPGENVFVPRIFSRKKGRFVQVLPGLMGSLRYCQPSTLNWSRASDWPLGVGSDQRTTWSSLPGMS